MNTKARPETKKTEPEAAPSPNFTVQQIENRLVAVLAPAAAGQGRVGPFVCRVDPRGPWHRPRFVHGPGVLVDPGRGVLLTLRRAGGLGIPGPASEDCDDQAATVTPALSWV